MKANTVKSKSQREVSFAATCMKFGKELRAEFALITWGDPVQIRKSVRTILLAVFLFGMGTYLADLTLQSSLQILRALLLQLFA